MALAMKNGEASNPVAMRLILAAAAVLEADPLAEAAEQEIGGFACT
jgi:hypothetical protein